MKNALALACLISCSAVFAQTAPAPQSQPAAPAAAKPGTVSPAPTAVTKPAATTTKPAATATPPAAKPAVPAPAAAATPGATAAFPGAPVTAPVQPPVPTPLTPEQRRQAELLVNAERIDKANRELLARNQELQLNNENLDMQLNIIRHDKSSEGIWKGALAVIAGFLMGWFFATSSHRKSSW